MNRFCSWMWRCCERGAWRAPARRQPRDRYTDPGELGALLLEAGLSVTDVRTSLETVRDSSAIDGDDLSFSVLPEMVIVTHTRTGAATVVTATTSDLSFRQAAHASQLVRHVQAGVTSLSDVPTQVTQIRRSARLTRLTVDRRQCPAVQRSGHPVPVPGGPSLSLPWLARSSV